MQITVSQVTKCYGKETALKDVSLQISKGEIVCLLGPSAAGKTTLIRAMIGATRIDSGEILIDNIRVPNLDLLGKIGYMPQDNALYNDLTGYDNLLFFGSLHHIPRKRLLGRISDLLYVLDLSGDQRKLVSRYSGGMKKRLSLAIALLHQPGILLLDEPTAGIDPVLRRAIWDQFARLRDQGVTIVVSTHVMDEALKCQRTAMIYEGQIIYDDATDRLLALTQNGNMEELFFLAKESAR